MGFLDGLGGKFRDFMQGPEGSDLNVTPGAVTPGAAVLGPDGALPQTLRQMPQIEQTGGRAGGFLDKLKAPDERGLTFGDKLFAAGSVLQGDSGGAATYLNNQRAQADALGERTRSRDMAKRGAEAFKNNLDPVTGELRFRGYLEDLGDDFDPMQAMKMQEAGRPDYGTMSTAGGGIRAINKRNPRDNYEVAPGTPQDPPDFIQGPDGQQTPNPLVLRMIQMKAAAERAGKPLAPRVGRSGGRPKSYGRDEIEWGQ